MTMTHASTSALGWGSGDIAEVKGKRWVRTVSKVTPEIG